jgi:hypothetical protein
LTSNKSVEREYHTANRLNEFTLDELKSRLADQLWIGMVFLAVIGWPTSMVRILATGWREIYAIQSLGALLMIWTYLNRKRVSTAFKAGLGTAIPFVVGIPALWTFGFYSVGIVWLVVGSLVAAMFYSRRSCIVDRDI